MLDRQKKGESLGNPALACQPNRFPLASKQQKQRIQNCTRTRALRQRRAVRGEE
jgi:hypothetical protein